MQTSCVLKGGEKCCKCGKPIKGGNLVAMGMFYCYTCEFKNKTKIYDLRRSGTEDFEDLEMSDAIEYVSEMENGDLIDFCISLKTRINELKTKK